MSADYFISVALNKKCPGSTTLAEFYTRIASIVCRRRIFSREETLLVQSLLK